MFSTTPSGTMAVYGKGLARKQRVLPQKLFSSDDEEDSDELVMDKEVKLGNSEALDRNSQVQRTVQHLDLSSMRSPRARQTGALEDEDELTKSPRKFRKLVSSVEYSSPPRKRKTKSLQHELMAASIEATPKAVSIPSKQFASPKASKREESIWSNLFSNLDTIERRSLPNRADTMSGTDSETEQDLRIDFSTFYQRVGESTEQEAESTATIKSEVVLGSFVKPENRTDSFAQSKQTNSFKIYGQERSFLVDNEDPIRNNNEVESDELGTVNINDLRSQAKNEGTANYVLEGLELNLAARDIESANTILISTLVDIANELLSKTENMYAILSSSELIAQKIGSIMVKLRQPKDSNGKRIIQWLICVTICLLLKYTPAPIHLKNVQDWINLEYTTDNLSDVVKKELARLRVAVSSSKLELI